MCTSRSQGVAISIISVQPLLHPLQTPVDRSRQQAGLRLCRAAGEKRCSCAKKCLLGNGRGHTLSSAACLGASRSATAASKQVATASGSLLAMARSAASALASLWSNSCRASNSMAPAGSAACRQQVNAAWSPSQSMRETQDTACTPPRTSSRRASALSCLVVTTPSMHISQQVL